MNEALRDHVKKIRQLPTLPLIAQEILKIVSNESAAVSTLEAIIQKDPSIAAKVMSVANSVYFGATVGSDTISSAIMRIGFENTKQIALGISLMTVMGNVKGESGFSFKMVYKHSETVGLVARQISSSMKIAVEEETMINGIIHDIGFLVLYRYFPGPYANVLKTFKEKGSLLDAENEVLGFTHADIGSWLANEWKLSEACIDVTKYHHQPSRAERSGMSVAVAHVADYITTNHLSGSTPINPNYPLDNSALEMLSMSEKEMHDVTEEVKIKISAE